MMADFSMTSLRRQSEIAPAYDSILNATRFPLTSGDVVAGPGERLLLRYDAATQRYLPSGVESPPAR